MPFDFSALLDDEPSPPERAQALAAALRGQRDAGQLAMLTGDKVLAPLGQSLLQGAHQQEQLATQSADRRFAKALEAQRAKAEQAYQQQMIAAKGQELEREKARDAATETDKAEERQLRRTALNQESNQFIPTASGIVAGDRRTGGVKLLTDANGNPLMAPPKGGGGGAGSAKEWKDFTEAMSTTRGRSNLAKDLQKQLWQAEHLEQLVLGPNGQIQNLTKPQVKEAAMNLARLISGGQVTESTLHELTPDSLAGKFADLKSYILNRPEGAEAQAFLENMLHTAARQKAVTQRQIHEALVKSLPGFAHLRKTRGPEFEAVLKSAGIDPASIDESGLERAPVSQPAGAAGRAHPQDAAALRWAKAYLEKHPGDPKATAILKAAGGG